MNHIPDNMTQHEYKKMLWNCEVRGIPCEYGICDECPNTSNNYRSDRDGRERENDNCK